MRDAGKTRIIVASARAILEQCPPVLLHWQACEYSLKLKSISQAYVNRPQKLSKTQRVFLWSHHLLHPFRKCYSLCFAVALVPWTCCEKGSALPSSSAKEDIPCGVSSALLHIGPVSGRVCPKGYSFLKLDFSVKIKIFVRTKQVLCSQPLCASNFLKCVWKPWFVLCFAYAQVLLGMSYHFYVF